MLHRRRAAREGPAPAGERGLDLIVIDYLQLMQGEPVGRENRVQEISYISRTLKGLARELDVPIIALAQLSRAIEKRQPRIPMLSDLRESGSIEQDADVVMFIYREEHVRHAGAVGAQHPDLPESAYPKGVAQVIVAKHRNGPTGTVELRFRERLAKFEDWVLRTDEMSVMSDPDAFQGFPGISRGTAVPNVFFTAVLPKLTEPGAPARVPLGLAGSCRSSGRTRASCRPRWSGATPRPVHRSKR